METLLKTPKTRWNNGRKKAQTILKTPHTIFGDTETTGLKKPVYPVEITFIHAESAETVFHELLIPPVPIEPKATEIHGHSIESLKKSGAKTWKEIASDIQRVLQQADLIVTYNWQYDSNVLRTPAHAAGDPDPWGTTPAVCAMRDVAHQMCEPGARWPRLSAAASQWGVLWPDNAPPHSAHGDTLVTLAVVRAIAAAPPFNDR